MELLRLRTVFRIASTVAELDTECIDHSLHATYNLDIILESDLAGFNRIFSS